MKRTLAALALRMVISCWAMTDNTSMSIRLNSSKQHQAPDCARPEKNRPIIFTAQFNRSQVEQTVASVCPFNAPRPRGHFGIARSVPLSVPWCSCLGYRHAGCLQLSHRRPPEMCGLRTRPQTDADPPRPLNRWTDADGMIGGETICHSRTAIGRGGILSCRPRGETLLVYLLNQLAYDVTTVDCIL